jgi:hypothetical protein
LTSFIAGDFSHFNDRSNPLKVTLSTFLKISGAGCTASACANAGQLYFQGSGPTAENLDTRPLCGKLKPYPTPCKQKASKFKVVKATATTPAGIVVTDVVLFVGGDPGLGRRL